MTIADMVYNQMKMLPGKCWILSLHCVAAAMPMEWPDLMQAPAGALNAVWDRPEDDIWDHV